MAEIGRLVAVIGGDISGLEKALGAAQSRVRSGSAAMAGDLKKIEIQVGSSASAFQRMGTIVGSVLAAQAIGSAGRKLVDTINASKKSASDLNEAVNKSQAVFKSSAGEIDKWAAGAARAFGQSKRQALDAAGGFGNMFDQLEVGSKQAATMSMSITELASDFASFHNADITQVLQAQSAAFRGEYDGLQRFLPLINAASVEQKAMEQTGKANAQSLTAQEKALAVYALMLEGAGQAQGDFAKTAGQAANQSRILAATQENLAAKQGQILLPAQIAINKALLQMPPAMLVATSTTAKFAPEALTLAGALAQVALASKDLGPKLASLRTGLMGGLSVLGPLTIAFGAAYAAQQLYNNVVGDTSYTVLNTAEAEKALTTATGLKREAILKALAVAHDHNQSEKDGAAATQAHATQLENAARKAGDYGQKIKDAADKASTFNKMLSDASQALQGFGQVKTPEQLTLQGEMAAVDARIAQLKAKLLEAQKTGKTVTVQTPEGTQAIEEANLKVAESYRDLQKAQEAYKQSTDALKATEGQAADSATRQKALSDARDAYLSLQRAQLDFRDAQSGVSQAQKNSTTTTNLDAEALQKQIDALQTGRDNLAAQLDILTTTRQAHIDLGLSIDANNQKAAGMAKSEGQLNQEIDDQAASLSQIPQKLTAFYGSIDQIVQRSEAVPPAVAKIGEAALANKPQFADMSGAFHDAVSQIETDANTAAAAIQTMWSWLDKHPAGQGNLLSDMVKAALNSANAGDTVQARAAGGPVKKGTPFLVGEKGQELFVPKEDGAIIPHGMFRTAANGAGDWAGLDDWSKTILGGYKDGYGQIHPPYTGPIPEVVKKLANIVSRGPGRDFITFEDNSRMSREAYDFAHAHGGELKSFWDHVVDFKSWADKSQGTSEKSKVGESLTSVASSLSKIATGIMMPVSGNTVSGGGGSVSAISFMAKGGPAKAGTPFLVGEKGQELFVPKQDGSILPAGSFRTAAEGAFTPQASAQYKAIDDSDLERLGIYRGWKQDSAGAKAAASGGPPGPLGGYWQGPIWKPLVGEPKGIGYNDSLHLIGFPDGHTQAAPKSDFYTLIGWPDLAVKQTTASNAKPVTPAMAPPTAKPNADEPPAIKPEAVTNLLTSLHAVWNDNREGESQMADARRLSAVAGVPQVGQAFVTAQMQMAQWAQAESARTGGSPAYLDEWKRKHEEFWAAINQGALDLVKNLTETQRQQSLGGGEKGAFLSGLSGQIYGKPVAQEWQQAYGRAKGGPVEKGTPFLVGEKGQELFVPTQNGMIIPNGMFRTAAGGAYSERSVQQLRAGMQSVQAAFNAPTPISAYTGASTNYSGMSQSSTPARSYEQSGVLFHNTVVLDGEQIYRSIQRRMPGDSRDFSRL